MLVNEGIAAVLKLYMVTPMEWMTSEGFGRVVVALKAAVTTIAAVITTLIRDILVILAGL